MAEKSREYLFEVQVAGAHYFTGDDTSLSVLCGNLGGRNFDRKDDPGSEHRDWLEHMEAAFSTPLPMGAAVVMLSPEGEVLLETTIGGTLPASPREAQHAR